jgi:phenylalanyl-tRNA synthetase beta chain
MKVPISWLKDYVDITLPLGDLAERLTLAGLEVSGINYVGIEGADLAWDRDKIVVGHILAVKPHPNADRLVLADVDYGASQIETVVTGAPNLFPYIGQDTRHLNLKSPFAMEGATLYDGHQPGRVKMTLKGRAVRGIMNRHMLCSEKELGISDEHEGILILDPDAPVGVPLADYLGTAVLDIDLTPNLARCASIIGVAREVAALTGQPVLASRPAGAVQDGPPRGPGPVRYPGYHDLPMDGPSIKGRVVVETTEPELNPRFCFTLIEGIEIKPSPYWMQLRLRLAGMRPINNIVDVSNYVMLEMGQPNHAFDYDVLRTRADQYADPDQPIHIITCLAQPGEHVTTLDDVDRAMEPFTILVTDPAGALSIGGIMGGAESEVQAESTNILLEAAAWNFINIRRSVKAYDLPSEAAYRFSRGVHPSQALLGALRGAKLMQQVAGGTIAQGVVDYYPAPPQPIVVDLPIAEVNRILGIDLSLAEIQGILESLEFKCEVVGGSGNQGTPAPPQVRVRESGNQVASPPDSLIPDSLIPNALHVTAPDHRLDISTGVVGRADLIEEIARIYGYDRFPGTQFDDMMPPQRDNLPLLQEEKVRDLLVENGLQEIITYRLTTPAREALLYRAGTSPADDRPYVTLANPTSPERTSMRHSLTASVLEVVASNARHRDRIWLFEIGPVFLPGDKWPLPDEVRYMVIAITGPREREGWKEADISPVDFYDLKGILESLLDGLHVSGVNFEPTEHPSYHPGRVAHLRVNDDPVGVLGQLHPLVQAAFDLPEDNPVFMAEIDFEALSHHIPDSHLVRPVPRFPAIRQDIALVVDESTPANQVQATIMAAGGHLLADARLFDVYRGEQIGAGKKSLAYTLTFQAEDRTLTDQEAAKAQSRIVKRLEKELGARLRG